MIINGGGAGGTGSDECTARLSDIPAGLKAVTADSNDEAGVGTMTMTGNAQAAHVLAGETFYTNNYKTKLTGTMTVGSILSFSAQAYSGRQILIKWQNPYAATGKPFSGVHVWYSTGGYPGVGGGTWLYSGYGGNSTSGGWCQAVATLPNLNTTYYFTACSYATCSAGDLWGTAFNAAAATGADLWLTFTVSQNYTVPAGFQAVDICCVGGGAGSGTYSDVSGGGGGGYVTNTYGLGVYGGQVMSVVVGAGGAGAKSGGGASYITNLASANGAPSLAAATKHGGNGGSGGGAGGWYSNRDYNGPGANGGSDGSNGNSSRPTTNDPKGGTGQGTTTRAWSNGTLYAGGGGGGGAANFQTGGAGGVGGGGKGADYRGVGNNGALNTGGGAGGTSATVYENYNAVGGSGIVLLHLY